MYLSLRDSPCGETSNTAILAVVTRGVSLLCNLKKYSFSFSLVAEHHVIATVTAFDVSQLLNTSKGYFQGLVSL
jgi:hypothetical protein